jgi:hypothetical protein
MAFNVNSFKAKGLEGGGARPALFEVVLTPPAGLPNVAEKISFLCRATAIPASTIGVVDVYHFGRPIRLAGDRTFSDWQVSIYNDEDFSIRDMLELWSNKINTHISNRLDPGYQSITPKNNNRSYKATGIVRQYGKTGPGDAAGIIRAYQFEGIFPFNISPIPSKLSVAHLPMIIGFQFQRIKMAQPHKILMVGVFYNLIMAKINSLKPLLN